MGESSLRIHPQCTFWWHRLQWHWPCRRPGRSGEDDDEGDGRRVMVEVTLKMSMTESHGDVYIFTWMLTWMVDLSYMDG